MEDFWTTYLHKEGVINGDHSILQHHAAPSGMCLIVQGFILQQDIDPKHNSKNDLRKIEEDSKLENIKRQTVSRFNPHQACCFTS